MSTISNDPPLRMPPSRRDAIVIALVLTLGAVATSNAVAGDRGPIPFVDSDAMVPLPTVWPPEPEPESGTAAPGHTDVRVLIEGDDPLTAGVVEVPLSPSAIAVPPLQPKRIPPPR